MRPNRDSPLNILIVDDAKHAREAMRNIIDMHDDMVVIGEAKSGEEAITLAEQLMPDLILMDIHLPDIDGLHATRIIKGHFPAIKVVIVTVSDDAANLLEALKCGAQGYLLKHLTSSTWYECLQAFIRDEVPLSRTLASQILNEFNRKKEGTSEERQPLTHREREVLHLVALGLTNKEIAGKLHLSEYTVKNHLKNIMQKLHLNNRVQLTRYAYEQGLYPPKN
ncbi:DNA-binding response regulator [Caldalkalibacillus thermarum]|uniref:response regulator n=1 Tax=Caldalkalibacillus thermarum TaxID=296745 RepID=UPI00166839BA|nr:response regulator transcription factor [Caldalkalibacillus thermarum]GGK27054.1 DNA-binding response regulator [Caldalkalibacillus thermarum]